MYFDRHVGDLTLPQAALLAGLPKAPQNYSPYDHPDQALRRRSLVLEAMVKTGAINRRDAEAAKNAPLELAPRAPQANEAPYYVEEVRKHMEERYGSNLLYRGGMTVNTTLDLRLQRIANRALEEWLTKLEDQYKFKIRHRDVVISAQAADSLQETNYIQGALVAMDPRSGRVLAMIGGRDFVHSKFNRATQAERQAGSSFKPFIYTAAIDGGFTPASVLVDAPLVVPVSGWRLWKPTNYDHTFGGPTTLRMALALSRNIIAVKLIMEVGPTSAANYAHKMGIKSKIPEVLSLALGSADVNLLEMVDAYSTLANQGTRNDPVLITKVTDRTGKILEEDHPMPERVLSTQTAFTMVDMMRGVVDYGTAARARGMGFTRPAAGKTGTTNDYTDTWFIGFTPDLACGVWVGFDQKKTIVHGATGSSFALPAWVEFMKAATATMPTSDFTSPGGMITAVICTESGLLATPDCSKVKNEVFISGTEPKTFCDIHKLQNLNVNVKDYNFERLDKQSLESPDFEKPKEEKKEL
jgi:penicillin-binding protein 1A